MDQTYPEIDKLLATQKTYFESHATYDIEFRKTQLLKLKGTISKYTNEIQSAMFNDLHKSAGESFYAEINFVLSEIDFIVKHLSKWAKNKKVKTPLFLFPASSELVYDPYGTVLIISPFNYPFQLCFAPLVGAIAAGNCILLKASPQTVDTTIITKKIIEETFEPQYVAFVEGGKEELDYLLDKPLDYIFFTGSTTFGRYVAQHAGQNLVPYTLELGGKSPCIVYNCDNIDVAAKRIVWGKFMNAGQTCVAPDYIVVTKNEKEELIKRLIQYIDFFYGDDFLNSKYYSRMISVKATQRVSDLINTSNGTVVFGNQVDIDNKYISPTIIDSPSLDSTIMHEEIFGPVLPIIVIDDLKEIASFIRSKPKPLSLYFFGKESDEDYIIKHISSGTMCMNDTVIQLSNPNLPFGGVGYSGIGNYHGHYSFKTFSHTKAVLKRKLSMDIKYRYVPFGTPEWLKKFL